MLGTKNRTFAKIFSVIMIVASIFIGAKHSFSSMEKSASTAYFAAASESEYSLSEYMRRFTDEVSKLIIIANENDFKDSKTISLLNKSVDIITNTDDVAVISKNYNLILENLTPVYQGLETLVQGNDQGFLYDNYQNMLSTTRSISYGSSAYDDAVEKMNHAKGKAFILVRGLMRTGNFENFNAYEGF